MNQLTPEFVEMIYGPLYPNDTTAEVLLAVHVNCPVHGQITFQLDDRDQAQQVIDNHSQCWLGNLPISEIFR